jgi:hypothetical protein
MGILEDSGMVTGYVIAKVETGSSEEGILVWIETLLLYQTKIIHSMVKQLSVFVLQLTDSLHGVLILLDIFLVNRLSKSVPMIDKKSTTIRYAIQFPIKLEKELEQQGLHCF